MGLGLVPGLTLTSAWHKQGSGLRQTTGFRLCSGQTHVNEQNRTGEVGFRARVSPGLGLVLGLALGRCTSLRLDRTRSIDDVAPTVYTRALTLGLAKGRFGVGVGGGLKVPRSTFRATRGKLGQGEG